MEQVVVVAAEVEVEVVVGEEKRLVPPPLRTLARVQAPLACGVVLGVLEAVEAVEAREAKSHYMSVG